MKRIDETKRQFTLVGLFAALLLLSHLIWASPVSAVSGVIEKFSASSFDKTVQKIKKGITANRLVLLKELDHQAMMKMVGVNAKKSKSFEVFHPRYGKKIHAKDLNAFIAVPIRIMVQERGRKVVVTYQEPSVLLAPYKGLGGLGKTLDKLFAQIVDGAVK